MAKKVKEPYENNPFFIGLNGLKLFFQNAQSVAIYMIVATVIVTIVSIIADVVQAIVQPEQQSSYMHVAPFTENGMGVITPLSILVAIVIAGAFLFVTLAVVLLIFGVGDYTSAKLAKDEKVELGEAFSGLLKVFPSYMWMNIVMIVKVLLWSLLLIVPGIIMALRYRLAGTVFFAEGVHGNAAVKRSASLTKGAWLTSYGGFYLWNIITQGLIKMVLAPGVNAILYRQLRDLTDSSDAKPPAHWLSWLTLLVPIAIVFFLVGCVLLILALLSLNSAP